MAKSVDLPLRTIQNLLIRDTHSKFGHYNSFQPPYIGQSLDMGFFNFQ